MHQEIGNIFKCTCHFYVICTVQSKSKSKWSVFGRAKAGRGVQLREQILRAVHGEDPVPGLDVPRGPPAPYLSEVPLRHRRELAQALVHASNFEHLAATAPGLCLNLPTPYSLTSEPLQLLSGARRGHDLSPLDTAYNIHYIININ